MAQRKLQILLLLVLTLFIGGHSSLGAYCDGDPIGHYDPWGLESIPVGITTEDIARASMIGNMMGVGIPYGRALQGTTPRDLMMDFSGTTTPSAIGKKNWLFIGAEGAGQSSAVLFTLVAECRRLSLNPQDYFTTALTRLPSATTSHVAQLTPESLAPLLSRSEPDSQARAA